MGSEEDSDGRKGREVIMTAGHYPRTEDTESKDYHITTAFLEKAKYLNLSMTNSH